MISRNRPTIHLLRFCIREGYRILLIVQHISSLHGIYTNLFGLGVSWQWYRLNHIFAAFVSFLFVDDAKEVGSVFSQLERRLEKNQIKLNKYVKNVPLLTVYIFAPTIQTRNKR